jgi:hypothetical protein
MIKEVGRLNIDDYKFLDAAVEKIFRSVEKGKNSQAKNKSSSWAYG